MKNLLTILLCVACLCANAQTDREILLKMSDQQTKMLEQQAKFSEQLAVNNTKIEATNGRIDALEKSVDKRLDFMQTLLIIIIPLVLTSVGGIIGFVLWDRSTAIRPIEVETKKEIEKLKEREQKLEDAIKKIIQIEPRFSGVI